MAIETIVVAVGRGSDDEAQMSRFAGAIADVALPTEADVVLLHVFGRDEYDDLTERLDFDRPGDATPDAVARRNSAARVLEEHLEDRQVAYEVRGTVGGDTGEAIVEFARDEGADQLFVGGRKRTPAGKMVFGSTAQSVLLNAPCPVTYVRHD